MINQGGVWGISSATTLETLPVDLRGLASGVLQQGYAIGNLIAAVINLTLVPRNPHGWRALFWTAAGLSFFAACFRVLLPESEFILRAREAQRTSSAPNKSRTRIFIHEAFTMMKGHWILAIYCVCVVGGELRVMYCSRRSASN